MVDEKSANPRCEFGITTEEEKEIREGKSSPFIDRIFRLFERVKGAYSDVFDLGERINLKPITLSDICLCSPAGRKRGIFYPLSNC